MSSGEEESFSEAEQVQLAVVNPFTEAGYAAVAQYQPVPGLPEKDTQTGHSTHNPHNLNTDAKFAFRQRMAKTVSQRALDEELLNAFATKRDVMYLKQRADSCHDTQLTTMAAYCLNHLQVVRDGILKGNLKLAKDPTSDVRDQGFTRPRLLFICPFKNTAYKFVTALMELWEQGESQVEQKRRFQDEYGRTVDSEGDEVEEDLSERPVDYQHVFAGNIDDCFRIGVKMTRKALKLYADFYSADILVVSPLGLKLVMDGQDQPQKAKKHSKHDKNRKHDHSSKKIRKSTNDSDYLSSIESVIVDQCDVIAMQNWEHLVEIFEKLNCLPKESHGCDFSRVMNVFLDKRADHMRQSVFLSAFGFPELSQLFNAHCRNVVGVELFDRTHHEPVLSLGKLKPEFHLLPPTVCPSEEAEQRLNYFKENLLSQLSSQNHVLLVASNYFEFLRLQQALDDAAVPHASISEYTDQKEVTRARSRFFDGHARVLLISERLHFFHRFLVKSVKRVVFYALPAYAVFVKEFVEMVRVREGVKVAPVVLVSALDHGKVERVFGTKNVSRILGF